MSDVAVSSSAILDRLLSLHPKQIDLVLDRIQRLLAALGHPERQLPPVIHVAGTNGKGSACAFARAMLEAQGARVHVYTSPHLVHFHERIRIAGHLIGEDELAAMLDECERANAGPSHHLFRDHDGGGVSRLLASPCRCAGARSGAGRPLRRHQRDRSAGGHA